MRSFYWQTKVTRITEERRPSGFTESEVTLELGDCISLLDNQVVALPRAGETYWLVDDATFQNRVWRTEDD